MTLTPQPAAPEPARAPTRCWFCGAPQESPVPERCRSCGQHSPTADGRLRAFSRPSRNLTLDVIERTPL